MNNVDRLAVITAIKKRLDEVEKSVRAEVVSDMAAMWEQGGFIQAKAQVNRQPVATVSLLNTTPKAAVTDHAAFTAWAKEIGFTTRPAVDFEGLGRLLADMHPELLAEYPEFVRDEVVLPSGFLDDLTNADGVALFDGTVVDGVSWQERPLAVRVGSVDTERIITALSAGAINAGDMLALPEED